MTRTEFVAWAALSSEALVLVANDGKVIDANSALRLVGLTRNDVVSRNLTELATTPSDEVQEFLRLCSRSPQPIATALTVRNSAGEAVSCRCDGMLAHRDESGAETRVVLKLTPKRSASEPYLLINETIAELNKELRWRQAAEQELRRSHETFYRLIQDAPFGVYVVDSDLRLKQASSGTQGIFRSAKPFLDGDLADLLHSLWEERFAREMIARFRHTLATGEPYHSPEVTEVRRGDNAVNSYDWRINRITLPDGTFGVVCYFYDLSELRRTESALLASEERMRAAAGAAHFGVYDLDLESGETYWSSEGKALLGLAEDAAVPPLRDRVPDFVDTRDRDLVSAAVQASLNPRDDGTLRSVFRVNLANEENRWVLVQGRTTFAEASARRKPVRASGTLVDVTERKRLEEELRQIAADLSEANRRKDEFLAILAHELRNPLAPIVSGLEVLERLGDERAQVVAVRQLVVNQVKQLASLVDDLLDVSRITSGKLKLQKSNVRVQDVVESALDSTRSLIEGKGHHLKVDLPSEAIEIHADGLRLTQVLVNLLNNAAKYTPEGGSVWLTAEVRDQKLQICVRDNGIGIPSEMLERVFEMFAQVGGSADLSQGLGIGLALAKNLVEMHGGKIEAQSDSTIGGSEFRITLPVKEPNTKSESAESANKDASLQNRRRIMVVDDNKAAAEMLSMLAAMLGAEVRIAGSGMEAVSVAREYRPDIVLMDLGMPGMNGFEATAHIRRQPWGREMKIVALTGWGTQDDKRRSADAGFDDHLVKPVSAEKLEECLRESGSRHDSTGEA